MLYTRKGDYGTTQTFGSDKRISKSSKVAEALGNLDEINSFLGLCKVKSKEYGFLVGSESFAQIIHNTQQNLFIIQAEVAGSKKSITDEKVSDVEFLIDTIEKILPPIKTFLISGSNELVALLDTARTIARRAERSVAAVSEEKKVAISFSTLAYLNRLSSILYALARLSTHLSGINEEAPNYK
jgi:cob(I)alamin adenosyltransferase